MDIKAYFKNKNSFVIIILLIFMIIILCYRTFFLNKDTVYKMKDNVEDSEEKMHEEIVIHIDGEVNTPGIVKMNNGQRLYEAIEKAGGTTENAQVESINLAMLLQDGQKIIIPNKEDISIKQAQDKRININTADKESLMMLPGIGETLAGNIIDYRDRNGRFNSIDEIKNVSKIGEATFNRLQELIKVE